MNFSSRQYNTSEFSNSTSIHSPILISRDGHILGAVLLTQTFIILSGSILALTAILKTSSLRTAFNIHLVSILASGLVMALHTFTVFLTQFVPNMWPFIVRTRLCPFFNFTFFYGEFIMAATHLLIALNRTWAMYFPLHYRTNFTARCSLTVNLGVWVLATALIIPWVTLMNKRPYVTSGYAFLCSVDMHATPRLSLFMMGFFFLSTIIIIAAYPVLWCKNNLRKKAWVQQGVVNQAKERAPRVRERFMKSHSFAVFSWIATSVFVFWLPVIASGIAQMAFPQLHFERTRAPLWLNVWTFFSNCFDPWVFIYTVPAIRGKVARMLRPFCPSFCQLLCCRNVGRQQVDPMNGSTMYT